MGAWGEGNFENDASLDWLDELLWQGDALAFLASTLDTVIISREDLLDVDEGCFGLGACEVIAALHDLPAPHLPERLTVWLDENRHLSVQHLLTPAVMAVTRIISEDSELRGLWVDNNDNEDPEWLEVQFNLISRLKNTSATE